MKTIIYKLSGLSGARAPAVGCKRKPSKAAGFDVAGSSRGSSRRLSCRAQVTQVRENPAEPGLSSH